MKYAFLTMLIPPSMYDEVSLKSKRNMQDAASALQWHIYDGLRANLEQEIKIFNVLPVGSFPQYYSNLFVKKSDFKDENSEQHTNIGFCNLKLLRKWHQPKVIYKCLKKWCSEDNEPKTLFVYTVGAPFMVAVSRLKKKYPKLKVCAIVADLPNMSSLSSRKGLFKRMLERQLSDDSYARLHSVDAFVLLTKQMADYMKLTQPYTVMEGISTRSNDWELVRGDKKKILYSGTLHKRFGVLDLIEAFGLIEDADYELVICGVGDSEKEIKEAASKDSRIKFMGQLKREQVLKLQREARALVNPRKNNEEFTKYSFPSKNLEYLSSGVPLVAYKLDGIPDEYDPYIIYVPDDTSQTFADILKTTCEMPYDEWLNFGNAAKDFVLNKKNEVEQTKKIVELINGVIV